METKMSKNFDQLIESIETMTVMELSGLVKSLEEKFGVSAASMAAPAAAPAAPAADDAAPAEEKTEFKVTLKEVGSQKIKVIKALRSLTTLGLLEAKKTVESAPVAVAEDVAKEEADKMKKALEEAGAVVELS